MYYILYLSSLCRRRRWPDPLYECFGYGSGYACTVRVNNRDYRTDTVHDTEDLAREAAAMHAYLICRNLSANENLTNNGGSNGMPSGSGGPSAPAPSAGGGGMAAGGYGGATGGNSYVLGQPVGNGGWAGK